MPCGIITVTHKSEALVEFAQKLIGGYDFNFLVTEGTQEYLTQRGVLHSRVLPFTCAYERPHGWDKRFFKTVDPAFYSAVIQGNPVRHEMEREWEPISLVVVDFKPLGSGWPDIGGPLLAKIAACAVLYENRNIFVLAGSKMSRVRYQTALADCKSFREGMPTVVAKSYARLALRAIAEYEAAIAKIP